MIYSIFYMVCIVKLILWRHNKEGEGFEVFEGFKILDSLDILTLHSTPYTLHSPLNSRRSRSNGPPKILIFGESGGASRLNADEVSSPCDLVTEREITGSLRVHKQRLSIDLYISLCVSQFGSKYKKKEGLSSRQPNLYLTLNLIPWKTRCKGTAFFYIHQILCCKNMFYSMFFEIL